MTWKAGLGEELVDRVRHVVTGGDVKETAWRTFPGPDVLALMAGNETAIRAEHDRVTIVYPDRAGAFSRCAGALALHGLDVLSAEAHSGMQGMAASEFRVAVPAMARWTGPR